MLPSSGTGGTEKQARLLAQKLEDLGVTCHLLYMRSIHSAEYDSGGLTIKRLNFPSSPTHPRYLMSVLRLVVNLRRHKYDIVHAFLPETIMVSQLILRHIVKGTLFLSAVRGEFIHFQRTLFLKYLYRMSLRKSLKVTCNSPSLQQTLCRSYGVTPSIISYIPIGIQQLFVSNPRKSEKVNRAVVISNFHVYKGFEILFLSLKQVTSQIELNIVGTGPLFAFYQKRCAQLPPNVTVKMHGNVDPSNVLRKSSFAIHPSMTEGQSNAILEELSFGLPVIAFNVGGNGSLIENKVNGILLDEISPIFLTSAINQLCTDSSLCESLSQNAFNKSQEFSIEKLASSHITLYRNLLNKSS
jgi:glycosyltransferase involved in cell wall biosynthesis